MAKPRFVRSLLSFHCKDTDIFEKIWWFGEKNVILSAKSVLILEHTFTEEERKRWNDIIIGCFRKFVEICEQHGLTYYCVGGTAIGCVRHEGLIPWDDDIDVGMPRPDYDRLLEIAQETDFGAYDLVTPYSKGYYPYFFGKFCDARTKLIENERVPCMYGAYIDVFPIDGTAPTREEAAGMVRLFKRWSNKIDAVLTLMTIREWLSLALKPKEWGRMAWHAAGRLMGRERLRMLIINRLERIVRKYPYEESPYVVNYGGAWGEKEVHPREWIFPLIRGRFEGMEVNLPGDYDRYLRQIYGDYMQLPPEEKRVSQHRHAMVELY